MARSRVIYKGSPEAKVKGLPKVFKAVNERVVLMWHDQYLASHFKQGAGQIYKYSRRSYGYIKRKMRTHGHSRPLVWSGESKRKASGRFAVTSTSKKGTGRFQMPWYFDKAFGGHPNKARELTAVTKKQLLAMEKLYDKRATDLVNAIKTRQTKNLVA